LAFLRWWGFGLFSFLGVGALSEGAARRVKGLVWQVVTMFLMSSTAVGLKTASFGPADPCVESRLHLNYFQGIDHELHTHRTHYFLDPNVSIFVIFPIVWIIYFTRPKVKDQFK